MVPGGFTFASAQISGSSFASFLLDMFDHVDYLQQNVWWFCDHVPISQLFQESCIPLKGFLFYNF